MKRSEKTDWYHIVQQNHAEDEERIKKGLLPRFSEERFNDTGNIRTTPEAEKFIEAHRIKRDEHGKIIPSTARGRRRRQKRQGSA